MCGVAGVVKLLSYQEEKERRNEEGGCEVVSVLLLLLLLLLLSSLGKKGTECAFVRALFIAV